MLRVNGVAFRYNNRTILNNVSFTAKRGEMITILGPNGSGKSTLLRCVGGLLQPCLGDVYWEDKILRTAPARAISRIVAYVPQRIETSMTPVFEAALLGRRPYFGLSPSIGDLELVESILYKFQLDKIANRPMNQLSGGEVQKVAIARSIAQEPQLLLLDEPTSMLDLKNQVELLLLLQKIVKEKNITAVLCMHDVNSAIRYADRLLLLKKGNLIFDVNKKNLTEKMIETLYELPIEIHKINNINIVIEKLEDRS
ncbi:MAG: ABC transporter ATP-binding protein [Planctomycetaceae bacterium]|jgi:iron complex transport system ATP-binding protein|nr:ABC transporter ATP-binding protein [Planctomycetaceae bacterium]